MHPPCHHLALAATLLSVLSLQAFSPSAFSAAALRPLPYDSVQWTTGFWADRHHQLATVTLPEMWRLLADPDAGHVLENFRLAAAATSAPTPPPGNAEFPLGTDANPNLGAPTSPPGAAAPTVNSKPKTVNSTATAANAATAASAYAGTNWQDEWLYKWIEAASCVWRTTRDPWILDRINESIALIAAAQQPDGYLSTKIIAGKLPRFTNPNDHEFYNMGHLLTAAAVHHRMTGDTALLAIARKTADYACATLGITVEPFVAHNPTIVMGLVDLYRITGEKRYLDTAQLVVDRRGTKPRLPIPPQGARAHVVPGSDLIQDRVPVRKSTEFVGQNVFSTYLYAGAADIVSETGERELDEALHRLWRNLTETKMYVHGGISALARGVSGQHIVTESAGRPHDLPNTHGYNETCGQIGVFMWASRMLQNTPDSTYADTMELELYNGFLGGIGLDGKSWFYRNVLRRYDKDYKPATQETGPLTDMAQRTQPGRRNICCPTNLLRTLAELSTHIYSTDSTNALWIHHYASSRAHVVQAAEPARSTTAACHPVAQAAEPARSTLHPHQPVGSSGMGDSPMSSSGMCDSPMSSSGMGDSPMSSGGMCDSPMSSSGMCDSPMQTTHNAAHPTLPPHHPIPPLTIEQITDYPWHGDIRIHIKSAPPHPVTLHLRIPAWAANPTLAINDQPVTPLCSAVAKRSADTALSDTQTPTARQRPTENREPQTVNPAGSAGGAAPGYATLTRTFRPGDTITLTLPMPVRLLEANPAIEQTRNQVAVKRGPLIYCLESPDIPAHADLRDISLPAAARFTTARGITTDPANSAGQPLADQIVTLKTTAHDRPAKAWHTLYRDLDTAPSAPVSIELIPYFSWSNRGPSAMSVWIPLATVEKIPNPVSSEATGSTIPNPK